MSPEEWDDSRALILSKLAEQKATLIGILSADYERGPKNQPFDPDLTWGLIELWAVNYHLDEILSQTRIRPADRQERARDFAKALRKAAAQVDETFSARPVRQHQILSDFGGQVIAAWLRHVADPPSAPEYWEDPRYGPALGRFNCLANELADLAAAADHVVEQNRDKRGRSRPNLPKLIDGLGSVYRNVTGLAPEAEGGKGRSFMVFVETVLHGIGVERHPFTLADDIRDALKSE